jgi:16S rRNA processing protein RimM
MGSRWLPFGSLGRPHGTKGEILLFPFNTAGAGLNESDLPLRVRVVKAEESVEANIVAFRPVHRGFLVRFADAESRESVGAMVGAQVHLSRSLFVPLAENEFYVDDIVGCEAFLADGKRLGRVTSTFWNGAQDVITIVADDGSERLVPAVAHYVCCFEPANRRLIVDLHE